MKKILFIGILISFIFIGIGSVNAESKYTFSDTTYVSGIYISLEHGEDYWAGEARIIKREDGKIMYSLNPFLKLNTNGDYKEYNDDFSNVLGITLEQWEKIELIMYYGYGYSNHNDAKWYIITQMLIWKTVYEDGIFNYTETIFGRPCEKFNVEEQEILSLVENHEITPYFGKKNFEVMINDELVITDTRGVLTNYELKEQIDLADIKIDGNKLIIKGLKKGQSDFYLVKKDELNDDDTVAYVNGVNQSLISLGDIDVSNIYRELNIDVLGGTVSIDITRGENYPNKCKNNEKTIYGLFDKDNNLIMEIDGSYDNIKTSKELPYGIYYVKQLSNSCNDLKDETVYEVEISSRVKDPVLHLEVLEFYKEVYINLKYGNKLKDNYYNFKDVTFTIDDDEYITNTKGEIKVKLGIGEYKIKQVTGKDNYQMSAEMIIKVKEDDEKLIYNLINEEKLNDIKVVVKDENQFLEGIRIGLYKGTQKIQELISNSEGEVCFSNLSYGDYEVKQLSYLDDYDKIKINKDVTLSGDNVLVEFTNKYIGEDIFIDVPDTYVKGDEKIINQISVIMTFIFYGNWYVKKRIS